MNTTTVKRTPSPRHLTVFVLLLAGSLVAAYALPEAQAPAKKAMTIDDYTKWRRIERQGELHVGAGECLLERKRSATLSI